MSDESPEDLRLVLDVSDAVWALVEERAAREGVTPERYVLDTVRMRLEAMGPWAPEGTG